MLCFSSLRHMLKTLWQEFDSDSSNAAKFSSGQSGSVGYACGGNLSASLTSCSAGSSASLTSDHTHMMQ